MLGEEIKYAFLWAFGGEDEPEAVLEDDDEDDEDEDEDDEEDEEDEEDAEETES